MIWAQQLTAQINQNVSSHLGYSLNIFRGPDIILVVFGYIKFYPWIVSFL